MPNKYRQVLYICCLTSFITITFAFGKCIFAVITPEIATDLNLNYEFIGRINAFQQGSYLIFSLIGGLASAFIGVRLLIGSSVILSALSLVSLSFVHNKWILLTIVALQGILAATTWIPMVELVAKSIAEENRGKSLGIISSGTAYGLVLNGLLIPYILTTYHWQTVWLVFGLISLIIGLFGVYVVYTEKHRSMLPTSTPNEIVTQEDLADIGQDHPKNENYTQYILLILLVLVSGLYLAPFQTYIVPFVQVDLGLGHKIVGIIWSLFGILGVVSSFIMGMLADKLSAKKAMIMSYGISLVAILILIIFRNDISVLLACGIYGLAVCWIFGLHPIYISRIVTPAKTAKLFGILNLALGFGSMIGNYASGYIKSIYGSFLNAYIFMAILSLIALGICFFLKVDKIFIRSNKT